MSQQFTNHYQFSIERASVVEEERGQYRGVPIRERVARCIWFGQYLDSEALHTLDGESVQVVTPGWWNVESGPDFLKAELAVGEGAVERGDVEIHLHASGWYQHGHHKDSNYNNVFLHVVLWNDREDDFVVNQAGQPVRQLIIEDNLERELGELIDLLAQEDFPQPLSATAGLCNQFINEERVAESWVGDFLDDAGDERILSKARFFARRSAEAGDDQAFYEGFMSALGYKRNKEPFETLARTVPLSFLHPLVKHGPAALQAHLFDVSGLLPGEQLLPGMPDPETWEIQQDYSTVLQETPRISADSRMKKDDWNFSGTRPVNFPTRRIAVASHFVAENLEGGLLDSVCEVILSAAVEPEAISPATVREIRKKLLDFLSAGTDPYWSHRCTFGGKPSPKPMKLIGAERVNVVLVNVVIPALLARASRESNSVLESILHEVYDQLPPLVETQVTRFMIARVLGDKERTGRLVTSARRQQGLYQLYSDFERDDRSCDECPFARAMLLEEEPPLAPFQE